MIELQFRGSSNIIEEQPTSEEPVRMLKVHSIEYDFQLSFNTQDEGAKELINKLMEIGEFIHGLKTNHQ